MDNQTLSQVAGGVVAVMLFWILWGYPRWRVWAAHQAGLADLQKAKNEQQIQIAMAQSRLDAAHLNKQAAIIEAEAVSEQIKTIGKELSSHGLYLRWQWIRMMENMETDATVIYVPTEANLPVLEAARMNGRTANE
jgi:regulator of protease activity HflC (stomatin/prohibitin superfamily)